MTRHIQFLFIIYVFIFYYVEETECLRLPELCTTLTANLQSKIGMDGNGKMMPSSSSQASTLSSSPSNQLQSHHQHDTMMKNDNGFELRLRRVDDGVMVDEWYESGRKYYITLTNRFYAIGFRDALMWIEPGMNKEKKMMMMMMSMKMDSSTLIDDKSFLGQQNTNILTDQKENCSFRDLGEWIHLSKSDLNKPGISDLRSPMTSVTQTRFGCDG
ncbi:unnamed protein product [Heterobilharzia americana]|nr:unnamed protein product [Heterobilharzia americana]